MFFQKISHFIERRSEPFQANRFLIVGTNSRSFTLAEEIQKSSSGYEFAGFVDNAVSSESQLSIVCNLHDLEMYISTHPIEGVFVTLPIRTFYDEIAKVIEVCLKYKVKIYFLNQLFDIEQDKAKKESRLLDFVKKYQSDSWNKNVFANKLVELYNNISFVLTKRRHPQIHRVLIAGLNVRSLALAENIRRKGSGYEFVGFIDNIYYADPDTDERELNHNSLLSVICGLNDLEKYISINPIDEVFITLPIRTFYDNISKIIKICQEQGVLVKVTDDIFGKKTEIPKYIYSNISNFLVSYTINDRQLFQYDIKMLFDIIFSFLITICLSPLLLTISLAIYFDDGLPVFFSQERIGLNKRRFKILKFRTMVRDAEKLQHQLESLNEMKLNYSDKEKDCEIPVFKITDDPRITKLGKFLRKTSLDELPQFFNVLKAEMSVIGPRPLPIRDFEKFYRNAHRRRFSVKPGITGLWQVSGRNDISFEEWMNLDLLYVDKWNLMMDLKILLRTIPAIIFGKGAK